MSPELDEINRTIKSLLVESVPNIEDGGISYLLHHIRDDVYVPIAISQENGLGDSEYWPCLGSVDYCGAHKTWMF
jgi:hypothetical protein